MNSIIILTFTILSGLQTMAMETGQDSIVVSVLTCNPGKKIYELCGHEAIRIRGTKDGEGIDKVWNYGLFDFNQPNFVYRFVKGETDYSVGGYDMAYFMPEYINSGRGVTEQELNLSQADALKILDHLKWESLPENREYRYNYVKNNCATKIINLLDSTVSSRIIYPDSVKYGSFRKEMRAYHKNYPWYQFGIDLALGSGLDAPITGRDEMFVPVEMRWKLAHAKYEDGTSVVRKTRILSEDSGKATDPPTVWYLTPLAISLMLLLIFGTATFAEYKRGRIFRWIYSVWYGICGLAGCVVSFLVFESDHEATSPNMLLVWLNPLQLLFATSIWSRKLRIANLTLAWYNIIGVGSLMLIWPFQSQSANLAFFPLMAVTVILAIGYTMTGHKEKFIGNEKNRNNGARRYGSDKHRLLGNTRTGNGAKTRSRNRR